MEKKRLNELVAFTIGKNITRLKDSNDMSEDLYVPEDFNKDLLGINETCEGMGCVINLIKSKAAPLSVQTQRKCITSNFLKCSFDLEKLDPWFFCYQFNEGRYFAQQISKYYQGNTLSVKKINIKSVGEVNIQLPDIQKQRLIGNIYRQAIRQRYLMIEQAEDIANATFETLRKMEEDY